ncbi:DUF2304 family protein [Candidatus Uhrbacteria bacterium]|nr:DUF2304 family protein [Candidatus Uhrbacteria bacterium]
MIIQFLLSLFVLFALTRVIVRYRAREITTKEFFLWLIFWIAGGVAIAWPNVASRIALAVGVGRGVDVIIYSALLLVFYVLFRIVTRIERMERDMTLLVRKKALEEHEK